MSTPTVLLLKPPMQAARGNHVTLACPPLGLAYLAATLRAQGVDVRVLDAVGEAPEQYEPLPDAPGLLRCGLTDDELLARVPRDIAVLGVTCMFSEEWPLMRGVLRKLRERLPGALILAGGEHITAVPEFSMHDAGPGVIDACVLGEGEETLSTVVSHVGRGSDWRGEPGLCVWDEQGHAHRTGSRGRIRTIDALPEPAWDLIPMESYLRLGRGFGVRRGRSIPVLATRGCPFQCTFCSSPQMWTTRWSARDPDLLLAEMERAMDRYDVRNFDFYDLTAVVRKDWIVTFARKLAARRWNITWQIPAGTRSEALDEEVVNLLAASGCRNVAYAPESGSPAVLARVKKKVNLGRMKDSMRAAVRAGLRVKCNLIMGFPDETVAEALETLRLCHELAALGIDDVNVTPFCPYPGSALFDQLRASGRIRALNDRYFHGLASYSDLMRAESYSEHLPNWALGALRWASMADFYGESFARHPSRFVSVARSLWTGRQETRLDKSLADLLARNVGRGARARSGPASEPTAPPQHRPAPDRVPH